MQKTFVGTALLLAFGLSACTMNLPPREPPASPAEGSGGACDASRAQDFVGKAGDSVAEAARSTAGAKSVRVIRPGSAVTMDYRVDRLNLKTDDAGTVIGVNCG